MNERWRMKRKGIYAIPIVFGVYCGMQLVSCKKADVGENAEQDAAIASVESYRETSKMTGEDSERYGETENNVIEENRHTDEVQTDSDEEREKKERVIRRNEERFYEAADLLGFEKGEAERYYQRLCDDNIFLDGTAELTALHIDDFDRNGQPDMVVMVQEEEYCYYGTGCIYFYMNEDEAYDFRDEEYPFFFNLNIATGDYDKDGYTEIAFASQGTGCGGSGDWHSRIVKYKDHSMERMEFPSDDYEDDTREIFIEITREMQENTYSAYCLRLDETITFEAENAEDWHETDKRRTVGGNSRGYFNLWCGEYEGQDALEVSEYLYGEGGIANCVGFARFLIVWDEDGNGQIVDWWVDELDRE